MRHACSKQRTVSQQAQGPKQFGEAVCDTCTIQSANDSHVAPRIPMALYNCPGFVKICEHRNHAQLPLSKHPYQMLLD